VADSKLTVVYGAIDHENEKEIRLTAARRNIAY
jgi:hypothetical protein